MAFHCNTSSYFTTKSLINSSASSIHRVQFHLYGTDSPSIFLSSCHWITIILTRLLLPLSSVTNYFPLQFVQSIVWKIRTTVCQHTGQIYFTQLHLPMVCHAFFKGFDYMQITSYPFWCNLPKSITYSSLYTDSYPPNALQANIDLEHKEFDPCIQCHQDGRICFIMHLSAWKTRYWHFSFNVKCAGEWSRV